MSFFFFSDMSTHLEKLRKCFPKCKKHGISLNPKECAFMVQFGTILRSIVSKEGKTFDPKKIEVLIKMPIPKTPLEIQALKWHNFTNVSLEIFLMALINKLFLKVEVFEWTIECQIAWEDIKN